MEEQADRPPINKKAVAAFVFGLLGAFATGAIIPALILWYLAVRDFRRTPNQRGLRLARTGVVVGLVVNIAILAFILFMVEFQDLSPAKAEAFKDSIGRFYEQSALTSGFRKIQRRNEAAVLGVLPIMRDSLNRFYAQYQGYPGSLQELVDAGFLQPANAQPLMHGYRFEYIVSKKHLVGLRSGRRVYSKFLVMAKAKSYLTGIRAFYLEESGTIHVYDSRGPDGKEERAIPPPADWRQTQGPSNNSKGDTAPPGQMGREKQARSDLERARAELIKKPNSAYWRNQAAVAYAGLGYLAAAKRELREAVKLEPDSPTNYYGLASVSKELGDSSAEIEALQKALYLDPANPLGRFALAEAFERSGKRKEALAQYKLSRESLVHAKKEKAGDVYYDAKGNVYALGDLRETVGARIRALEQ
jgi:tetratricopeptide (TPR) repeat protein